MQSSSFKTSCGSYCHLLSEECPADLNVCELYSQCFSPHSPSHYNYVYCKLHSVKCNMAYRNCVSWTFVVMNFCFCFVLLCFVSSMYCLLSWEYTFLVYHVCQVIRFTFSHPRYLEVCVCFCSPCIKVEKKKYIYIYIYTYTHKQIWWKYNFS
jgi:hypothetical protein